MRFKDKVAVVTGGGTGMGKSHCRGFLEEGARVVVADIDYESARKVAEPYGDRAVAVRVDVSREEEVEDMYRQAQERFGTVDYLVNNAALLLGVERPFKPFWELGYDEWNRVMGINAGGIFLCCKHAKNIMAPRNEGRIVNISSDAIYKGYESQLAYFASKGAVSVMTRNLARELGQFNINVNAVAPGYTLSESTLASPEMNRVAPLIMASNCIKYDQLPEDVTGAVLFLCSPESRCITGQSIVVNCGAIMP